MKDLDLPSIIALSRAGATGLALRHFDASGLGGAREPGARSLKGRLLKDLARMAAGGERRRLYREASAAYRQSAELAPATYPLINAASLSLLAGDGAEAAALAQQVLDHIEANPDEPETPYWRVATRAEALLLLGRHDEARAAFAEAIALAPEAWEDHASTLRQFALVLEAQAADAAWLEPHRPPRSIHFGGHMSFDARVSRREHLDEKIAAVLSEEKVGFGYGALAAGADIIVAEALLARGAELHAVLPGGAEAFASVSVDPFGKPWRKRFDALLGRAATVRAVRPVGAAPDPVTIALADEIAMGAAAMNARRLESRALQLFVVDSEAADTPAPSAWRRRVLAAPREAAAPASASLPAAAHCRLALLTVRAGGRDRIEGVATILGHGPEPAVGPYFTGGEVVIGYGEAAEAATAAVALAVGAAVAVGGHYGAADPVRDPFSGELRLGGEAAALASGAAASAPPGAACVTADFAAALAASGGGGVWSELIGEMDARDGAGPVDLYALKPRL
jgi:tetratricopeptide (TPR) repeat protein